MVLQSESCGFEIPEIGLHLQAGTLGGRFTTLEGILTQVYEELSQKVVMGDSIERTAAQMEGENEAEIAARDRNKFSTFLGSLKSVRVLSISRLSALGEGCLPLKFSSHHRS